MFYILSTGNLKQNTIHFLHLKGWHPSVHLNLDSLPLPWNEKKEKTEHVAAKQHANIQQ